ncbi:MAG: SUMF1/EgtB/PvdO family nonheme iron enzyme [Planctomycetes bacterium]|nr:SUMF1/EgtB/PvdO family nonheme iron enzyme [Planctomycetota bacterium]
MSNGAARVFSVQSGGSLRFAAFLYLLRFAAGILLAAAPCACTQAINTDLLADVAFVPPDAFPPSQRSGSAGIFIGITEVTNQEFARFVKSEKYKSGEAGFLEYWKRSPSGDLEPPAGLEAHPVVFVNVRDANRYAAWRGMRLPTRMEWESAASYGVEGGYPFGVWQNLRANTLELGLGHTTPVGFFENGKSFLHLYDMAGNVGEIAIIDDEGIIVKGGSFAERRVRIVPAEDELVFGYDFSAGDVGFRCVADAIPFITERVLRAGLPSDTRVQALAIFLKKSGASGRQLLEKLVETRPETRTLVEAALSYQY